MVTTCGSFIRIWGSTCLLYTSMGFLDNIVHDFPQINLDVPIRIRLCIKDAALGESSEMSGESSSRSELEMPDAQRHLLEALLKTGKPMEHVFQEKEAHVDIDY